jgi:hypothetical protein
VVISEVVTDVGLAVIISAGGVGVATGELVSPQ